MDPDPYRNVTDPQLWLTHKSLLLHTKGALTWYFLILYCVVRYSFAHLDPDQNAKIRVQSQIFAMTGRLELGLEKGSKTKINKYRYFFNKKFIFTYSTIWLNPDVDDGT